MIAFLWLPRWESKGKIRHPSMQPWKWKDLCSLLGHHYYAFVKLFFSFFSFFYDNHNHIDDHHHHSNVSFSILECCEMLGHNPTTDPHKFHPVFLSLAGLIAIHMLSIIIINLIVNISQKLFPSNNILTSFDEEHWASFVTGTITGHQLW